MAKLDNNFFVYVITCVISRKSYVGVTTRELKRRWSGHIKSAKDGSKFKFHNAIRKHGARNFKLKLLKKCSTLAEAFSLETVYIAELKTFGKLGYNMTPGGEGVHGIKWKKSSRTKFSKFKKQLLASPEARKALSVVTKKACSLPNFRKGARRRMLALWKDEKYRVKIASSQRKAWKKKGRVEAWREARAADWRKPGYRKRMTRALKRGWKLRREKL